MKEVKNLIAAGENLKALQLLAEISEGEDKNTAIVCLNQYNNHWTQVHKGIAYYNPIEVNQIMWRALLVCDKKILEAVARDFAQPPYLDNLPLDKEGFLLGRKAALEQLHDTLKGQRILTLVNGMGGIGKSTLASFYANFPKYRAIYSHCFWITVSDITGDVLEAIINTFTKPLELYQMPQEAQLQKISSYLNSLDTPVLLVIDNANDDAQVEKSLAWLQKTNCKLLFTTRANIEGIEAQFLAELLPEDAFTLFTHHYAAGKDHPLTRQLLANVSHHTLLTEFMAKTLNTNPTTTIEQLIEITSQQDFTNELFAYTKFKTHHTHTHGTPYQKIQPAKYLLQIFPIQNLSEQEQQILRYFSIFPAEWIEMNMLLQLFAADQEKTTHWQLGQVLQTLHEKGWLQKSPSNSFICHILVQHILRQQLQPNAENCELLLQNLYAATWHDSYTNKLTLAPYLPLVAAVLTWVKAETQLIANVYNNSATIYRAIGDYQKALSYDVKNIRIKEKILADDDPDLATAYNNVANTYRYLGDYQKSLEYALKDMVICEKVLSAEHPDLATSYDNIGLIYQYLVDYQQSLEYHLKALSIREKVLGAEHPDLANSYNNIALTYQYLGDYQQSLEYHLKAVSIRKKVLNAKHPLLATSYNNIGETYRHIEDYQKALEYGLKALSIFEKVLSAEHPDLATSYNNIAVTYYYLRDYTIAYAYIQKAVAIWTKVLPKEHPDIQDALDAKAVIEEAMRGGKK